MTKWFRSLVDRLKETKLKKIKHHLLLEKIYWDGRSYDKKEGDYERVKYDTIREIEDLIKEIDGN
jgi:hypothetical protein